MKFGRGNAETLISAMRIANDEIKRSIPLVNSNGQ
jgi:hypothetical protein